MRCSFGARIVLNPHQYNSCSEFILLIKTAIDKRNDVLFPSKPLDALPLNLDAEEKIRIELDILKNVLSEFERLLGGNA